MKYARCGLDDNFNSYSGQFPAPFFVERFPTKKKLYFGWKRLDEGVTVKIIVMKQLLKLAAMLMLVSSVTHVVQLQVYPPEHHVIGAAAFGIIYFFIGLFLLRRNRLALWLGAIMPSIGGILGVYRFLFLHPNPFTIFHVLIDLVVVPICIYNLNHNPSDRST